MSRASLDDKRMWLIEHRELWAHYERHDRRKRLIVEAMRRDGLVSRNTWWKDVNLLGLITDIEERE